MTKKREHLCKTLLAHSKLCLNGGGGCYHISKDNHPITCLSIALTSCSVLSVSVNFNDSTTEFL